MFREIVKKNQYRIRTITALVYWKTFLHASTESTNKMLVENILKGSLDSIPSPSPSVKIQIMGGKVC